MKLLLLALVCVTLVPAFADETPPPNVRIEVQMVAIPEASALELIPNFHDAGSVEFAFGEVQKLIAKGDGELIAWPEVTTVAGQRAVTEDIEEVRYPTKIDRPSDQPAAPKPAGKKHRKNQAVDSAPAELPEFETRNVGATLEVEPSIAPDGSISLNIVPQYVRFLGFNPTLAGRDASGKDVTVEQPQFYTTKTTTQLKLRSGQRVLLASFRTPKPAGFIQLFILKAELLPTPPAGEK